MLNLTGLLPDERPDIINAAFMLPCVRGRWIAEMQYATPLECQAHRGRHRADVVYVAP